MINICISLLICLYFVSDVCLFAIFRCLDYTRVAALQFGPKRLNTGRWDVECVLGDLRFILLYND